MYLDHILILIQQSILFYLVSIAKNNRMEQTEYTTYYLMLVMCTTVILPKDTFDYLIVRSVWIFPIFFI